MGGSSGFVPGHTDYWRKEIWFEVIYLIPSHSW
jgi:hypothetical protein